MKDSYQHLLEQLNINKEIFFEHGLKEIIYIDDTNVKNAWEELKDKIKENKKEVFIRGYGRDAAGTQHYMALYKKVFNNYNVKKDATNNAEPKKIIEDLTGKVRNKNIQNYQISHLFGRTKNIYAFTAPWNIAYIPKMFDPFTGHEAKGKLVEEFQALFFRQNYKKFKFYIEEFNEIMTSYQKSIDEYINGLNKSKFGSPSKFNSFKQTLKDEFSVIDN